MKLGLKSNIVLLIVLVTLSACSGQQSNHSKTIHSLFASEKFLPNWHSSEFDDPRTKVIKGDKVKSKNMLSIFSQWDKDSLYFFFKVNDSDLRTYQTEQDHSQLFLDDMVEILIDTRNDKDSCWNTDDIVYHINLLKVKKDDRGSAQCKTNPVWNGNARISVQVFGTLNDTMDIDKGYLLSLGFPWSEMDQTPRPGLTMGINFANSDNDGKGRQLFDWVGAWPMRSPYVFGDLILINH